VDRRDLAGRTVIALTAVQLVGYAALSAVVAHSDLAPVVGALRAVPTVLLLPLALVGVPAVVVAVAVGAVLSLAGLRPTTVLVVRSAYGLSVAAARISRGGEVIANGYSLVCFVVASGRTPHRPTLHRCPRHSAVRIDGLRQHWTSLGEF